MLHFTKLSTLYLVQLTLSMNILLSTFTTCGSLYPIMWAYALTDNRQPTINKIMRIKKWHQARDWKILVWQNPNRGDSWGLDVKACCPWLICYLPIWSKGSFVIFFSQNFYYKTHFKPKIKKSKLTRTRPIGPKV